MRHILRILIFCLVMSQLANTVNAQESEIISANNIQALQSVAHIDFANIGADFKVGWFVADEDATRFIIFDAKGNLYRLNDDASVNYSWTYMDDPDEQIFSVIDAVYYENHFFLLTVLDGEYFVDGQKLDIEGLPVGISEGLDNGTIYVESLLDDGQTKIYKYGTTPITNELTNLDILPFMPDQSDEPLIRIGRIKLPTLITSSMDNTITWWRTLGILVDKEITFHVDNGPVVFGSINADGRYFAWSDPNSTYLNILDLWTGENRIIAELDGDYAQYYLLSHDASVVIVVNSDFVPHVFAWDVATGTKYDLEAYRECERIPDKVELSQDGRSLIIGCDTGLDIWRIVEN